MWGSLLAGLGSAVGGSLLSGNNQAPSVPNLPYQEGAANNVWGDISSLINPYPTIQPLEYQQLLASMNNPYLSKYMRGANRASDAFMGAGHQANRGANLLMKDARGIFNESFDPQNKLRKQLTQRTQDQSNVNNAMYGLSSSPYGAGVADQNLNNFNIDWQNQQLQRMLSGAGAIGQNVTGAQNLRTGAAQDYLQGGMLPYSTYNSALGTVNDALDKYMQQADAGNQFTQQGIGDWLSYLTGGNQAAATNLAAYNANQNTSARDAAGLFPFMYYGAQKLPWFGGSSGSASGNPSTQDPWNIAGGSSNFFDPYAGWGSQYNVGGL